MRYQLIILLSALLYAFTGCKSKPDKRIEQQQQQAPDSTAVTLKEAPDTTLQPIVELILRASGETPEKMAFDQDTLYVTPDALVKLTLINEATELNSVHNFVLTTDGKYKEIALAGAKVGSSGHYTLKSEHVLTATPIALPGQTIQHEFEAPPPGTYDFVCTYPDHLATMHGKMIVK
ncbi:plastocyanin/azurin family copper-binding protein [Pontibacter sp. H259]|uniref:plastocyanin/azurin family copper-binding protein n=1 Tax=Pontibacter sp. H259 TaxID=3133421 RepID=UPI0030C5F0B7